MIEIKTFSKAKTSSGTVSSGSSGGAVSAYVTDADHAYQADKAKKAEYADTANYANDAAHAARADYAVKASELDENGDTFRKFLRRDADDTAEGAITFEKAATFLEGLEVGDNFRFDKDGNIVASTLASDNYDSLAATDDHADKRGFTVAVKDRESGTYKLLIDELRAWSKTVTDELVAKGAVSNGDFVSGFLDGKGWGITSREVINSAGTPEEKWTAEFDNIVVRGGLKVYEMVVSQLVGENDNRVFTGMLEVDHYDTESGRVYLNTNDGQTYNPFRTGDYIMVRRYTYDTTESSDVTKGYELIVEDYGNEGEGKDMLAWVTFGNFTSSFTDGASPEDLIAEGDTFVRVDNLQDPDRKGIVQIVSVGTAAPYMDVIHGLKTDPDNALKARIGNLQGIIHPVFGHLLGFGLYSSNAYLTGDFVIARTGENVDTKFQILEDRFSSQIAKTEDGLTDDVNFLHNGRFLTNEQGDMDGWTVEGDDAMWYLDPDGNAFMVNGQTTMEGTNRVTLDTVGGKKVLHLTASGDDTALVRQANALIRKPTTHKEYATTGDTADTAKDTVTEVSDIMYLSCKILPKDGTTFSASLGNSGLIILESFSEDATEWKTVEVPGAWDGEGDFVIRVNGDCYVTDVMLTTDPVANLAASYETSITQTAKKIELQAKKVTAQGTDISNLSVRADSIESTVSSHTGSISTLQQTASDLSSTVKSHTGSISTLRQTADSVSVKVGTLETGLSATGIDIANKSVTITADKFTVKNNSNESVLYSDSNGNLVVSGEINASKGKFGIWNICTTSASGATVGYIETDKTTDLTTTKYTQLGQGYANFYGGTGYICFNVAGGSGGKGIEVKGYGTQMNYGVYATVERSGAVGLYACSTNGTGIKVLAPSTNPAINVEQGTVNGLRLPIVSSSSSVGINNLVGGSNIIFLTSTSYDQTVTLPNPSSNYKGAIIIIVPNGGRWFNLKGKLKVGGTVHDYSTGGSVSMGGTIHICICDGSYWSVGYTAYDDY